MNPELRETRRRVLHTHYQVTAVASVAALKSLPESTFCDLLVLCHTMPQKERAEAIQFARERWPGIKILGVSAPYTGRMPGDVDAVVAGLAGPVAMFEAIARLLPNHAPDLCSA